MVSWLIVAGLTITMVIGQQAESISHSYKWNYKHQFATEQGCKDYLRSDAFADDEPQMKATIERQYPGAKVDFIFRCEALGDPA